MAVNKTEAIASLDEYRLLLPAWVKAALAANDRLKLYLSVLQSAASHAEHPEDPPLDLHHEMAAAGLQAAWLHDLAGTATRSGDALFVPELPRLAQHLAEDLAALARPVLGPGDTPTATRVEHWRRTLAGMNHDRMELAQLRSLTHGNRGESDSLHLLVMDLHKQLNQLSASLASEIIDGAHVWQIEDEDRARVAAFMRGLNRTAPLKLDHPGLDTAATRDGERLLLQNDIGTNDAHVLVLQVTALRISLTYSDLHRIRFAFFQSLLGDAGARWSVVEPRVTPGLNQGGAYWVGTATFDVADEAALQNALESVGARIVFLIDWNRARKRLQQFVGKASAVVVLQEAARLEAGHMAWLQAGAERLVFGAMEAMGEGAFRLGDRLEDVLGAPAARQFLVEVLRLASRAAREGQPPARVADDTRLLLARCLRQRSAGFEMLSEHMGYCHALAQSVSEVLAMGDRVAGEHATEAAARAKTWERRADHLLMDARALAERQAHWLPFARLIEISDDVADALEEASFLISLAADNRHSHHWDAPVRQALQRLADAVLGAVQEQVKAVEAARTLGADAGPADNDDFVAASWNVLRAERQCDELLRVARRAILGHVGNAAALMLANDLALALELASDRLLAAGYALRDLVFSRVEARA
jgi:uncharacterized protein Yka (UPF0111/DUF47 family)